jgi:hypothetical protein
MAALNQFQQEREKSPKTLMKEKELKYCTVSMKDHIRTGELASNKLNILSSADTSLRMFLHEMKSSLGEFDQTIGTHLNHQNL